jgi:hypothetical protein
MGPLGDSHPQPGLMLPLICRIGRLKLTRTASCPSRPEWLRLECDFEPGGDRHFSGLGVSRQVDMTRTSREQSPSMSSVAR